MCSLIAIVTPKLGDIYTIYSIVTPNLGDIYTTFLWKPLLVTDCSYEFYRIYVVVWLYWNGKCIKCIGTD